MKINWASIRAVSLVLSMLAGVVALVFLTAGLFTGNSEWGARASLLMVLFSLPISWYEVVQSFRDPKPEPSTSPKPIRWHSLLMALMIPATFGWASWFAFGYVWMGILAAIGAGVPMTVLLASRNMMEPGPRAKLAFVVSMAAMVAVPMLMVVAFGVVSGSPGR
jgi:hypothetical protein